MKEVRLGIAGLGTVAQGVLSILSTNRRVIAQRTGIDLSVSRIASRTAKPGVDLGGAQFSTNLEDLYTQGDVDVVVELIGGETLAKTFIENSLAARKPVVTANKAVIAANGNRLLADHQGVPLVFEAAVAGAIPIIQAIQNGLVANRFEHVVGIINGTCNYILTAMQSEGTAFSEALKTAQELGYAEADPTFDVEGIDAAHKLAIMLGLAFDAPFNFDDIYTEGISNITGDDIKYAQELGYRIKHVGIARQTKQGLEARVHPTLIPEGQLLANVNDVLNAVLVKTDAAGTTLFSGPGAGGAATASAVLADVVAVAKVDVAQRPGRVTQAQPILPIEDVRCAHYLRIPTRDEPGVFAQVANALSKHDISIEAAIQREPRSDQALVSIVILTGAAKEADIQAAVAEVQAMPQVGGDIARIRVETLD